MRGKRIRGVLVKFSVAVRLCLGGSTNTGGWAPQSETQINHRINQPHGTGRARQTAIFSAKLGTEENSQDKDSWSPRSANQIKTNKMPKQLTNATKEANKASKQATNVSTNNPTNKMAWVARGRRFCLLASRRARSAPGRCRRCGTCRRSGRSCAKEACPRSNPSTLSAPTRQRTWRQRRPSPDASVGFRTIVKFDTIQCRYLER